MQIQCQLVKTGNKDKKNISIEDYFIPAQNQNIAEQTRAQRPSGP